MAKKTNADPIEFFRRGPQEGLPEFVACGSCGQIYSPRIYASSPEKSILHAIEAAKNCSYCNKDEIDPAVEREKLNEIHQRRISLATHVTHLDYCFSDSGDCFYCSVEEAAEAGETGVFGAEFEPYHIDADSILENIIEKHHDDASVDDLVGVDALIKAIDAFNNAQKNGSYHMNTNEWQKIPQTQTFGMIKPDATARGIENEMMSYITSLGFKITQTKRKIMTREEAEWLYQEHKAKSHFNDLVDYTISGEVVMMLIEGDDDNVPASFRKLMGATDHTKAEAGTLRAKYAVGYRENSIHGSDSPKSAIDEIIYFMN